MNEMTLSHLSVSGLVRLTKDFGREHLHLMIPFNRLGLGSVPLEVTIKYKQALLWKVILFNEPQILAHEFEKIQDVLTVNLMTTEICGIAGEETQIAQILQLLALQIITHHGYDDVKLLFLLKRKDFKWNFKASSTCME